jgi:hypothetical protein
MDLEILGEKRLGKVSTWKQLLIGLLSSFLATSLSADEVIFNFGGGPQWSADNTSADTNQINKTIGIDYGFFRHERSPRSSIDVGASYTYMKANSQEFNEIHAISIYPQLTLYPGSESWIRSVMPDNSMPFFYVRALGPSYISANQLGTRHQAQHFAFQAQIGVGAVMHLSRNRQALIAISWKHFSNANLFDDNDGIDLPIVMNFGVRF